MNPPVAEWSADLLESSFKCSSFWFISSFTMGDHVEVASQITPETPGRPCVRNPFESPNDYHHLCEAFVPSPSVFKSNNCKSTPPRFDWSIEELASLLPVHIDSEEIQRQSFYLSQTRIDSDIEEKRQNAIQQFFTKGTIVPSPWVRVDTCKSDHLKMKSCVPGVIAEEPQKNSVACQTTLSLPLDFDLKKVLGDYYQHEEACDVVQENLSSSSLRRKLFLDGESSYSDSDCSSPPSPERSHVRQESPLLNHRESAIGGGKAIVSTISSPLPCGILAQTPTSQFSSSPIRNGCFRDHSLGSITSPLFPDRSSPAVLMSPAISPIVAHANHTPTGSAKRMHLSSVTPHGVPLDTDVTSCSESPFVEGCSPIRNCLPHQLHCYNKSQHNYRPKPRLRVRSRLSPPLISPIFNPKLHDNQESEDLFPCCCSTTTTTSVSFSSVPHVDLDPSSPLARNTLPGVAERISLDPMEHVKMEEGKETRMDGMLQDEEEESREPLEQLTSSRMGNVLAIESSNMCVSLLMEGSSTPYDSSMQVDSGYNTTSAAAFSLIDGLNTDSQSKESCNSNMAEAAFHVAQNIRVKAFYPHH